MRRKYLKILNSIFSKPIPSNILWNDVESLILALDGEIEKGKAGSRIGVVLNGKATVFHRPHPQKEMDKGAVKNLKEFLEIAGVCHEI